MTLRRSTIAVAAAVAGAILLALRLLLVWRFPPFIDEALYAFWSQEVHSVPERRFISLASAKEPLLTWLGALGIWSGLEPLTAVRLVSVGSGAVTCVLTALIAGRVAGRTAALAAGLIYAMTPFVVVHDSIGIYEPLASATVAAALYLVIRLASEQRLDLALLLGVAFGLGLLTKQSTLYAVLLLPTGLLLLSSERQGLAMRLARWAALNALAVAIAAALHSIMRLSANYAALEAGRQQIYPVRSVREGLSHPLRWLEQNWPEYREALGGYLTLPLVLAAAVGLALLLRERTRHALVLLAWIVVPLGANVLVAEIPFPRYLVLCLPPTLALAGVGLVRTFAAVGRVAPGRQALAVAAVATLTLLPAAAYDVAIVADPGGVTYPSLDDEQFVSGWAAGTGWEELADELEARARGKPPTVVLGDGYSPWIQLRFRDTSMQLLVDSDPRALDASFAIENGYGLPRLTDPPIHMQGVQVYKRPHDGTPLVLYQRVAEVNGRVYESPQELRDRLPEFVVEQLLDTQPPLRRWFETWGQPTS